MSWLLAAQAGCFLLAIALGVRSTRRDPSLDLENALRRSRGLRVLTAFLLAAAGSSLTAQVHDPFCQALPLRVQRHADWLTWLPLAALFAVVSGYATALAFARRHRQRWLLTIAVLLLHLTIGVSAFRYLAPIAPSLGPGLTRDGVVLQTTGSTCGAATLANVARRFGISLDERAAAELLLTSRAGTSRGAIRYALEELGMPFRTLRPGPTPSLARLPPPAILFVDHPALGRESHVVAFMGGEEGRYEIWDPLVGKAEWDESTASAMWHGNGIVCTGR